MKSLVLPRLLLVGSLFAFAAVLSSYLQAAAGPVNIRTWSVTQSQENVQVESCAGSAITTSYSLTREIRRFNAPDDSSVFERQQVDFAGAIGNAVTGKSYAYDGQFTRYIDSSKPAEATIANLKLRFEVGTPGMFEYTLDKVEFDLSDNPAAIVQAIVPHVLRTDLCSLLGGPAISMTPNNIDTNEPLQNLTPNYAPLPCDQPRMDPAYSC